MTETQSPYLAAAGSPLATAHVDPPVCGACHHLTGEHDDRGALRFFCQYHADYIHATGAACPAYVPAALAAGP